MKYILILFFVFFISLPGKCQPGCTDSFANNYNAAATENNGSCTYNVTGYTPMIKADPLSDSVAETSGLKIAAGFLWTFNDSQGKPQLYRIDTLTNTVQQRVYLAGTNNNDWEDIAFDGNNFYIGDFGNNLNGGRTDLKIYKFPLTAIDLTDMADTIEADQIEVINFIYSDQPQPAIPSGPNNTKFDCEAMIVDNNKIHLFSKNWIDNSTTHYVINNTNAGNDTAWAMETLSTGYLVTSADKAAGQNIIVLLGYQNTGFGSHYLHILSDYKGDSFFTGNKRRIDLGDATTMGQAEGVTFRNGKYGYISNEKFTRSIGPVSLTVSPKLKSFDLSSFTADYYTKYVFNGNGNWSDKSNWKYQLRPPSSLLAGNEIIIDSIAGGVCNLDIQYTMPAGTKLTVKADKNFVVNNNLTIQ